MADMEIMKIFGQVAGIGGLSLGVFLILYRDIIRKNIFPRLPAQEAYKLLRLITGAVWSLAIIGIAAWVYTSTPARSMPDKQTQSGIVNGNGNVLNQTMATTPANAGSDVKATRSTDGKNNTVVQERIP